MSLSNPGGRTTRAPWTTGGNRLSLSHCLNICGREKKQTNPDVNLLTELCPLLTCFRDLQANKDNEEIAARREKRCISELKYIQGKEKQGRKHLLALAVP